MKCKTAMKYGVILLLSAGFFCGCVTSRKYDALKKETDEYKKQNESAGNEARLFKQRNEDLTREVQQLRQIPEYYFKTGTDLYSRNQFQKALEYFEKIIDRYPTDSLVPQARDKIAEILALSAANYEKILKAAEHVRDPRNKLEIIDKEMEAKFLTKEDAGKLLKKRDEYYDDFKFLEEAARHIIVEDDPTRSLRLFRTTRSTARKVGYDKNFYVEIYVIQHYSGKRDFRIKTRYIGDKWISYESLTLKGDNGTQADVVCKYPEKQSSMVDDHFYEWSDNDIDDEKVIKLSKSETVLVRFNGGYKYSFDMNDEQLLALREIVRKYQSLK